MSSLKNLADQRPTNWGHHLYHSKVNGDLSHDRHKHINTDMFPRAYGKSNHMQMLKQRQHFLLNYFKPLVLVRPRIEPEPPA